MHVDRGVRPEFDPASIIRYMHQHEMFVLIRVAGRKLGVPLSQLEVLAAKGETREAVEHWRYWVAMDKLSVYDAKAHFSELIERAQSGRATVIAKRGHAVAKIVPAKEPVWDRSAVLDEAEVLRKKLKMKGRFKIADLIAAGRL